jgi:RNA polymerase sigma factor (sigma-70 family)
MKFDSNAERRAYWTVVTEKYTAAQIQEALERMPPDTSRVLQLHYVMKYPLKDIAKIINRSMAVVRNHHNRGIVKLFKHFNPDYWKRKPPENN